MEDHGGKTGVAKVNPKFHERCQVEGAGDFLRRECVVKVGGKSGRERYSSKQTEDQIDGVDPNHTRPIAQA
jgi:hypothetical protein